MSIHGITFSSTVDDGFFFFSFFSKFLIAIDIISEFVSGGSILNIVELVGSFDEQLVANFMK